MKEDSGIRRRQNPDISYFLKAMTKRFPEKNHIDIEEAVRTAGEIIAPRKDQVLLKRETLRILKGQEIRK